MRATWYRNVHESGYNREGRGEIGREGGRSGGVRLNFEEED